MQPAASTIVAQLITSPNCHFCARAHEVLGRLVREGFPLRIEDHGWDDADGAPLVQRDAVPFPPALYLDGELWGFGRISERALRKRLAQRSSTSA